jgi:hypothetical protein
MQGIWVDDAAWTAALGALPADDLDVYFTPAYHRLHEQEAGCVVVTDGGLRLVVPGLLHPIGGEPGAFDLQTCNGYGGPLASAEADAAWLEQAWAAWRQAAAARGVVAAFFRLHPLLDNRRWLPREATIVDDREAVLIDLGRGADQAFHAADSRFRNKVRRAERAGLDVRWDAPEDWPAFETLYGEAMERLGAVEALRFRAPYFRALRALPGVTLGALHDADGLLVAAVFLGGGRTWYYHLGARRQAAENQAMSFLFHRATQRAAGAGARGLYLGGGATPADDDSLLRFKRLFSPVRVRFHVARVIADRERFAALIARWELAAGRRARWLLGYRESMEAPPRADAQSRAEGSPAASSGSSRS